MRAYNQNYRTIKGNTTVTITADTDELLAPMVLDFRVKKSLPRATLPEVQEDLKLKAYGFQVPKLERSNKPPKLTFLKAVTGARALFNMAKGDMVSQQELDRRASICAQCPIISDVGDSCKGCAGKSILRYARSLAIQLGKNFNQPKITAQHTTPVRTGLLAEFYCTHCGCSCLNLCLSKSKLFLQKENKTRPLNCWANPNSPNWQD